MDINRSSLKMGNKGTKDNGANNHIVILGSWPNGNTQLTRRTHGETITEREYSIDGICIRETEYNLQHGLHGTHRRWREDGSLREESHWKNGKRDGVEKFQRRDGTTMMLANWKNGKKHGWDTEYYYGGTKMSKTQYFCGKKHGEEYKWNENRELIYYAQWMYGDLVEEHHIEPENNDEPPPSYANSAFYRKLPPPPSYDDSANL